MLMGSSPSVCKRDLGQDWPPHAETMIGMQRLTSLQHCVETVLAEDIPGDLVECGVWRGGACILMRAGLAAYGDETRCVWLADSYQMYCSGPDTVGTRYPHDPQTSLPASPSGIADPLRHLGRSTDQDPLPDGNPRSHALSEAPAPIPTSQGGR